MFYREMSVGLGGGVGSVETADFDLAIQGVLGRKLKCFP